MAAQREVLRQRSRQRPREAEDQQIIDEKRKGEATMSTVSIYEIAGHENPVFLNEIPLRDDLEAMEYADQLAKEEPDKLYVVRNIYGRIIYQR